MLRALTIGLQRDPAMVEAGRADGAARKFNELERRLRAGGDDAFAYACGFLEARRDDPKQSGG